MAGERIAVVGATGVVGQELLSALLDREFPAERLTLLGSERSEGTEVEFGEETLEVERAGPGSFRGIALALFATPKDASAALAPAAQAEGAWVVDASSAFRGNADVPVMLPAVGISPRPERGRIVRVPSAVTTLLAAVLDPLRRHFGLLQAEATALLAASAAGQRGVNELERQTADLLSGRAAEPGAFPHRVGFNLVPQAGELSASGVAAEEAWAVEDLRAMWPEALRGVALGVTAIQVPLFFGHAASIAVRLERGPAERDIREALKAEAVLKVLDSPEEHIYPLPMTATADAAVHVGRVRALPESPDWVRLYAVIDNAGRGAALNVVEAGEALWGRALEEEEQEDGE